jgi:hypothetical protein
LYFVGTQCSSDPEKRLGGNPLGVSHKTELEFIDGTPEKRFFLSLISDYDLKAGLCELVDNAIDFWRRSGSEGKLRIDVDLDPGRQTLRVSDTELLPVRLTPT